MAENIPTAKRAKNAKAIVFLGALGVLRGDELHSNKKVGHV